MKRLLVYLLVVLCLITLTACAKDEPSPPTPTEDVPQVTETPDVTDVSIKTPYCDLVVTKDFADNVKSEVTSQEPYTLSFRMISDGTELFSIIFGGETENLLGTLPLENENVVIYTTFNDFDSKDENFDTYCAYQEDINTILQHLISDYGFIVNEIVQWEDTSTFDIETSVVTMKYPNKWKDKVTIDVTKEVVKFSCNGEKLFDLCFTECDGYLLGTYKDTPIYIVDYVFDEGRYSEDELNVLYAMQEDVNVILHNLMKDSNFKY